MRTGGTHDRQAGKITNIPQQRKGRSQSKDVKPRQQYEGLKLGPHGEASKSLPELLPMLWESVFTELMKTEGLKTRIIGWRRGRGKSAVFNDSD